MFYKKELINRLDKIEKTLDENCKKIYIETKKINSFENIMKKTYLINFIEFFYKKIKQK